jgi:hypothetical protein
LVTSRSYGGDNFFGQAEMRKRHKPSMGTAGAADLVQTRLKAGKNAPGGRICPNLRCAQHKIDWRKVNLKWPFAAH